MATVYITEYEDAGDDYSRHLIQVAQTPEAVAQTVTPDGTGVLSSAFGARTGIVRVAADVAVLLAFGVTPVGADAKTYLPSGIVEYFSVVPGQKVICKTV